MIITQEIIDKLDSVVSKGFSNGLGNREGVMCIEAAICFSLGLPHGDYPNCVSRVVRAFSISLNDSNWSSPKARAKGMRALAIAQLGSKGIVDDTEFSNKLVEKVIRVLIPTLFREVFPNDEDCLAAADRCEKEGSVESSADAANAAVRYAANAARYATTAASARYAADAAGYFYAVNATIAANAADAASARAADAADAASARADKENSDKYLEIAADLALEVLQGLGSPGCAWL